MKWVLLAFAATLALPGCKGANRAPESEALSSKPSVSFDKSEHGNFITVESDTIIDGKRAKFVVVCENGPRSFQLYMPTPAASPPPLRGNWAKFLVAGKAVKLDLGWGTGGTWFPGDNEKSNATTIAAKFVKGEETSVAMPQGYGPSETIRWSADLRGPEKKKMQEACAG